MDADISGTAFILSGGLLQESDAKTTHGLLRGSERFKITAVIDPKHAGRDAGEVLDGRHRSIPVMATIAEALVKLPKPDFCIIGVATVGGVLPPALADTVQLALKEGISIVNGLHDYLNERPEMAALAAASGAILIDVRKPKKRANLHFWTAEIFQVPCPIIAVLGMDCAMGKRTTARLIRDACRKAGLTTEMIYTGQTGWMQGNRYGFIFDSTLNDFVTGELEYAILSAYKNEKTDLILLEGQSSLRNPSGPCGPEFMVSGNARHVVLIHEPKREYFDYDQNWGRIPTVESEIELINKYGSTVIALAINTTGCSEEEARKFQAEYARRSGIPVILPLQDGVESLLPVLQALIQKH
ncbi:DUF1611 domain-containing protein [Flavihumibacter profundi]|uniref:DUF1611 domain-containing protein n=1 Tax=Flavihumibacter profundi TaxID=2716883 RepID=UPI001CC69DE8|nr:DUF1611 domain-containing protein [Flavihumibacter profundi]MBZ5856610.1 DUF1611 domain-containing protein [Flavihumibacter profundi]